jgi:hypothetical protein
MNDATYREAVAAKDAEMIRKGGAVIAKYPDVIGLVDDAFLSPDSAVESRTEAMRRLLDRMTAIAAEERKGMG